MLTICCRCSAANVNMPCPQMLHFLGASNQHSVTLSRAVRAPRCTQGKRKLMKGPAPSRHYAAESDGDANSSGLDSSISESSHSYPGLSKKNVEKQAVFPPPMGFPTATIPRYQARPGWGRVLARLGASSCCQSRAMRGGG